VALNIAEGSTGQTDAEQARFLGLAIHSPLETVACQHLINRREYLQDVMPLRQAYVQAEALTVKLQAMREVIAPDQPWLRDGDVLYEVDIDN
jgi:four helix bundle protein